MSPERTIASVPSELSRRDDPSDVQQEGNLLIEAVSLLVQRQRETETWISEQLWQAEQRAADSERRYSELESRLASIEAHLARLVHEVEPGADDGQMARLREQIQDLRGETPLRATDDLVAPAPAPVAPTPPPAPRPVAPQVVSVPVAEAPAAVAAPPPPVTRPTRMVAAATVSSGSDVTFWDLLGSSPQDRAGIVLIGLGAVAVVYAVLTQLRFA